MDHGPDRTPGRPIMSILVHALLTDRASINVPLLSAHIFQPLKVKYTMSRAFVVLSTVIRIKNAEVGISCLLVLLI